MLARLRHGGAERSRPSRTPGLRVHHAPNFFPHGTSAHLGWRAVMRSFGKAIEAFCIALALVLIVGTADAQKRGGTLRIPNLDSPASMSIHEEVTVVSEGPMMPVFNNLVLFDQHVAQNSLQSIVPELATGWSWNDDKTQLKFTLRQGVKWHDGKP